MAIFVELAPNKSIKEGHPHVKGENVTNTQRCLGNGARYDATNSLALARTRLHSFARPLLCTLSNYLALAQTLAAVSCDRPPVGSSLFLHMISQLNFHETQSFVLRRDGCY